jgi:hypothetical protein
LRVDAIGSFIAAAGERQGNSRKKGNLNFP